jgi:hypothetical protein
MRFAPLLLLAAVLAAAGCADVRAIDETRDDRSDFGVPGARLMIHNDGGSLRLVATSGDAVVVERSLTGKATLDGNASWQMAGGTLRLGVTCSGFVPDCGGRHVVHVPAGVAVEVTSDAPVRAVGLDAAFSATVRDAWLRVDDPAGKLRLEADFAVQVTGARSADVAARSTERGVSVAFAAPPTRVQARAAESVAVTLPAGPQTYRVTAAPGRPALRSDPASPRIVAATAGDGHTARVRKAG